MYCSATRLATLLQSTRAHMAWPPAHPFRFPHTVTGLGLYRPCACRYNAAKTERLLPGLDLSQGSKVGVFANSLLEILPPWYIR